MRFLTQFSQAISGLCSVIIPTSQTGNQGLSGDSNSACGDLRSSGGGIRTQAL